MKGDNSMENDKKLEAGSERGLPPLGEIGEASKSGGKKVKSGVKVLSNKPFVSKVLVFVVMAIISLVVLVFTVNFGGESNDSSLPLENEVLSEEASEAVDLDVLSPLLLGSDQEQDSSVLSGDEVNDSIGFGGNEGHLLLGSPGEVVENSVSELPKLPSEQLDDVLTHLSVLEMQYEQLAEGNLRFADQINVDRSKLLEEVKHRETDSERIAVLEESVATLMKEVKRLKWVKRTKKTARKKSSIKVHGFFVWQYRPGVEIEHNGVFERFYEGDVLDGMRLIKIDMDLEQVVFSRKGKQVVFKLEEG